MAGNRNRAMSGRAVSTADRIRIADLDLAFEQEPGEPTILRAALRAGIGFPYECQSGGCGCCRFRLKSGTVDVLWPDAPGWTARDKRRGFFLACQTRARGDVEIAARIDEACRPKIPPRRHRAKLVEWEDLTPDMRRFVFSLEDAPADFLPGQYALLSVSDGPERCYSMSNLPNPDGVMEFVIRKVPGGRVTQALFAAGKGAAVTIDAPYGLAHLSLDSTRDVLCVGGGSGLAPMLSILRGILRREERPRRIDFYYGARGPADLITPSAFPDLAQARDRYRFVPVLSDLQAAAAVDWQGRTGLVHEAVAADLAASLAEREIYFAGPPPMAEAMQRMLMLDHQVPFQQIHYDRFF